MPLKGRVSNRNMLKSEYKFKLNSELETFVKRKRGFDKKVFTLQDILSVLKHIISKEKLFDPRNVSIIVCSQRLEKALNVRALHVSEFRSKVLTQLVKVNKDIVFPQYCWERGRGQSETRPGQMGAASRCIHYANVSTNTTVDPDCKFSCSEKLLLWIKTLPEVKKDQTIFSYKEITKLVSGYIITNKLRLFDQRNVKVCIVTNDPLGYIFGLNYFHRCQLPNLLMDQLIPVTENDKPTDNVEVRSSGSCTDTPECRVTMTIQSWETDN